VSNQVFQYNARPINFFTAGLSSPNNEISDNARDDADVHKNAGVFETVDKEQEEKKEPRKKGY
jgi:hypothetical protein